jgi:hypothetical protein
VGRQARRRDRRHQGRQQAQGPGAGDRRRPAAVVPPVLRGRRRGEQRPGPRGGGAGQPRRHHEHRLGPRLPQPAHRQARLAGGGDELAPGRRDRDDLLRAVGRSRRVAAQQAGARDPAAGGRGGSLEPVQEPLGAGQPRLRDRGDRAPAGAAADLPHPGQGDVLADHAGRAGRPRRGRPGARPAAAAAPPGRPDAHPRRDRGHPPARERAAVVGRRPPAQARRGPPTPRPGSARGPGRAGAAASSTSSTPGCPSS